jgi:TolA-binding protein
MKLTLSVRASLVLAASLLVAASPAVGAAMSGTDVDRAMARGYAAIKVNDVAAATAAFSSVIQNAPDSPTVPLALLRLGHLQLKTDSSAALDTFSALAKRYPNAPQTVMALNRIGALDSRLHRYDDAQNAFRQAAEHKCSSSIDRGKALLQVAFLDIMKFYTTEYWGMNKDGALIGVKSDTPEAKAQHLEDARKLFEAVRDEYAKSAGEEKQIAAIADAAIGEIYLAGKIPHLAERAYWRALREYGPMPGPLNSLARYGIGQAKYRRGDLKGAVEQFDLLTKDFAAGQACGMTVAPANMRAQAAVWKVVALSEMGQLDEALAAARVAKAELASNPDSSFSKPKANLDLWEASLLSRTGSAGEAVNTLQSVIDKYPGTPQAYRAKLVLSELKGGQQ